MLAETYLETPRLVLRDFTSEDEGLLVDLDSDPEVMRYITNGESTSRERVREWVLPRFTHHYSHVPKMGCFAAHERVNGAFIGWFHLRPAVAEHPSGPDTEGQPELGYRLKRSAWGKGYATEGSLALLRKGFEEYRLPLIVATAMKANRGSWHVMEKIGMKWERDFKETRFPGKDRLAVKYVIRAEDYLRGGSR